jgi:hypothetical protein
VTGKPKFDASAALVQQLVEAGLPQPHAEWAFADHLPRARSWRFDFAWPTRRIAVEIEGGAFVLGRHVRGTGFERDAEKYATAVILGWRVIRVTPRLVKNGHAAAWVQQAFAAPIQTAELTRTATALGRAQAEQEIGGIVGRIVLAVGGKVLVPNSLMLADIEVTMQDDPERNGTLYTAIRG